MKHPVFLYTSLAFLLVSCGNPGTEKPSSISSSAETEFSSSSKESVSSSEENPSEVPPSEEPAPSSSSESLHESSSFVEPPLEDLLTITFLEMNECYGDSFLIQYGDFDILVDGGAAADATSVRSGLKTYVKDGVLDMLIVSHPHADHTGGLSDRNTFREITEVKTIVDYGYQYSTSLNRGYESNRQKSIDAGAAYYPISTLFTDETLSPVFEIADGLTLEFLNTGAYLAPEEVRTSSFNHNETSIACALTYKDTKFFFAGDLEAKGERAIQSAYPGYFEDSHVIYKASHHGSLTSNKEDFLRYLSPEAILISAALVAGNQTANGIVAEQHPYIQTIRTFEKFTKDIYWNGLNGTFHYAIDGEGRSTFRGEGAWYSYYVDGTKVDTESEKDLPFPETSWYAPYMALA